MTATIYSFIDYIIGLWKGICAGIGWDVVELGARIGIFGSFARGENNADSDLDIRIQFKERVSLLKWAVERDLIRIYG